MVNNGIGYFTQSDLLYCVLAHLSNCYQIKKPSPLGKVAARRADGRGLLGTFLGKASSDLACARPPSPKGKAYSASQKGGSMTLPYSKMYRYRAEPNGVGFLIDQSHAIVRGDSPLISCGLPSPRRSGRRPAASSAYPPDPAAPRPHRSGSPASGSPFSRKSRNRCGYRRFCAPRSTCW